MLCTVYMHAQVCKCVKFSQVDINSQNVTTRTTEIYCTTQNTNLFFSAGLQQHLTINISFTFVIYQ